MSDWQPIETAPKDGRWIIVFYNDSPCGIPDLDVWLPGMRMVRWVDDSWMFCSEYSIGENPTHWMQLPKPPTK